MSGPGPRGRSTQVARCTPCSGPTSTVTANDELVSGKRVYAHEVEPGVTDGSLVAWYHFDPAAKNWVKHVIFQGEPAKNAPAKAQDRLALRDFPPAPPAPAFSSPPSTSTAMVTSTWSAPARAGSTCSRTWEAANEVVD